jgi:Tfp pilus assembly protein FimT
MKTQRKGVTLVEMLIAGLIIAVMLFVAVPRFSMATAKAGNAETTAQKIAAGLRYARSLAISNAAINSKGFSLNMTGSGSYTGFTIVDLGSGKVVKTETINENATCTGADDFQFGPLGNRLVDSDSLIVIAGDKMLNVTVISATGMVQCRQMTKEELIPAEPIEPVEPVTPVVPVTPVAPVKPVPVTPAPAPVPVAPVTPVVPAVPVAPVSPPPPAQPVM